MTSGATQKRSAEVSWHAEASISLPEAVLEEVKEILAVIQAKNVKLWSDQGELRYRAPKGALTRMEIERIKGLRQPIVHVLEASPVAGAPELRSEPKQQTISVPLTYSQQVHWNFRKPLERATVRQIASATRLRGRLNVEILRQSIAHMARRHEALRTRLVVVDGVPAQEVLDSIAFDLKIEDLTSVPPGVQDAAVASLIDAMILDPIEITVGPLWEARLAKLGDVDHVLIVAMEHIISDAYSMNILMHELLTVYSGLVQGTAINLPPIPIQLAEYAVQQRRDHQVWLDEHENYWSTRLAGCKGSGFPEDARLANPRSGWGTVSLRIEKELKSNLQAWCRTRHTTVMMAVLTVYVALLLRWCSASDMVVRYQSDGRSISKLKGAIGFFASKLFLRIQLREEDSFVDILDRVSDEYCNAYEHMDFSYIDAQVPEVAFARNPGFNWIPQPPRNELIELAGSIDCEPFPFVNPVIRTYDADEEPIAVLYEFEDEISGGVHFPRRRFSPATLQEFVDNFWIFLKSLLEDGSKPIPNIR